MCSLNAGGPEDRCGCAPREGEQTSCSRCVQVATDLAPVRLVRPDLRLLSQRLGTPFGDGEPEPGAPPFAGHRRELKATLWSVLWLILEHESCHMALCHRVEMLFLAPLK